MVCDLAKINGTAEATPISIRLVSPRAALSNMLLSSESDVASSETQLVRIRAVTVLTLLFLTKFIFEKTLTTIVTAYK